MSDTDMIRRVDAIEAITKCKYRTDVNIAAAINDVPAQYPTVKPLEWVDGRISSQWQRYTAETLFGTYEVMEFSDGAYGWSITFFDRDKLPLEYETKDLEAAKAAAQAHCEAETLTAITTQPSPDVSALVEAARPFSQAVIRNGTEVVFHGVTPEDVMKLRASIAKLEGKGE